MQSIAFNKFISPAEVMNTPDDEKIALQTG